MHLIIDGFGADQRLLGDVEAIYRFLDQYPEAIGMTKITPPAVYTYVGQKNQDIGISGFVLIAESHISVHTFPQRGYVNIDIFSCKAFDTCRATEEIKSTFVLESVKSWTLDRGLEYSDQEVASQMVAAERADLASRL